MQVNQPKEGGTKATTPSAEHTLVVRYAAGEEPSYSAATEILGGRLVAVDFDGNRLAVADRLLEALETLASSGDLSDDAQFVADQAIEEATHAYSK
ncbi:hypothetical protein [Stutzerimonas nitrititolerans]|uniref:hypothetical protein n=1 Tax=Stutzerimonas nitrititolerans TaxID=2482751 RepID=UPI0028A6A8B0|nr:hypothetical protein [Stutzerimonas nitrititolerans]